MADQFSPIEHNGGWWQLRRSYDGPDSGPGGFVLVVKRKDGKNNEWRGSDIEKLVDMAVNWCIEGEPIQRRRRKKKVR